MALSSDLERMKAAVLAEVDRRKDEAVGLLQSMIRLPSFNPPGNEKDLADYNAAFLREIGFEVEQIEPFEKRVSNIARLPSQTGNHTLLFNSHLDTVPPGNSANWAYPPFSGEEHDGVVWGLGAKNMKSGMAAAMFAARLVRDMGIKLRGGLMITQTADEMQMGLKGLKVVVERGLVKADYAIYTECDAPLKVEIAHRGLVWLDVVVHGYSTHTVEHLHEGAGGKPINAIEKMVKVIDAISRFQFQNWKPHPYLPGEPIISVNMIWGGYAENMRADKCAIRCDIRTIPPQTTQTVVVEIQRLMDRLMREDKELKVSLGVYGEAEASVIEPDEPIVRAVKRAVKEVAGVELVAGGVASTSDARWLILKAGIPCCKFSFATGRTGTNEHVRVSDYLYTIKAYSAVILNLLA